MGNHACITAETSHTGFVLVAPAFSDRSSFDMGGGNLTGLMITPKMQQM